METGTTREPAVPLAVTVTFAVPVEYPKIVPSADTGAMRVLFDVHVNATFCITTPAEFFAMATSLSVFPASSTAGFGDTVIDVITPDPPPEPGLGELSGVGDSFGSPGFRQARMKMTR
jgi:hypothetical protein